MKNFYTISQTAKIVDMTAETLRHYDRIDLVKPGRKDECTGYRYYTNQEIVKLNTIKALQYMDLTLQEIKKILEYDDLEKIVEFLKQAEKNVDEKISLLKKSKSKMQSARKVYENKLEMRDSEDMFEKEFEERIILLSDAMEYPTLDNLYNYHRHFYNQVGLEKQGEFTFEDVAGIYDDGNKSRLFAVCDKYVDVVGLKILPKGKYICANCNEDNKEDVVNNLIKTVKMQYHITPDFVVNIVVVTGILQWKYQIQIFLGE